MRVVTAALAASLVIPFASLLAQRPQRAEPRWSRLSASISVGSVSSPGWFYEWMGNDQSNWTVGAGVHISLSEAITLGVEAGYHPGLTGNNTRQWTNPPWTPQVLVRSEHAEERLWWGTLSTTVGVRVRKIRPYVAGSVGIYWLREVYESQERDLSGNPDPDHPDVARHRTDRLVGGNVGLGIEGRRLLGPLGFGIRGCWHVFLEPGCNRIGGGCLPNFRVVTLMVTVG
jgi:opacity protein-like surface antigen